MSCRISTRACRRCGGDLSLERDQYGTYIECIQCGANWNVPDMKSLHSRQKASLAERKLAAVR